MENQIFPEKNSVFRPITVKICMFTSYVELNASENTMIKFLVGFKRNASFFLYHIVFLLIVGEGVYRAKK